MDKLVFLRCFEVSWNGWCGAVYLWCKPCDTNPVISCATFIDAICILFSFDWNDLYIYKFKLCQILPVNVQLCVMQCSLWQQSSVVHSHFVSACLFSQKERKYRKYSKWSLIMCIVWCLVISSTYCSCIKNYSCFMKLCHFLQNSITKNTGMLTPLHGED